MVNFKIKENPYDLNIEDIVAIGKRNNNEKRNFLFISKLLGRHVSTNPDIVKATGYLLSSLKYDIDPMPYIKFIKSKEKDVNLFKGNISTPNRTLVIGFTEGSTALGMSVAASIKDSAYVCTTKAEIDIDAVFTFEEHHSNETTHKMYFNNFNFDEIILVEDEITTGKTMLNLIKELRKVSPATKFSIFTILDWRDNEYRKMHEKVQKELEITIDVHALISGEITTTSSEVYVDDKEIKLNECKIKLVKLEDEVSKKDGKIGVTQSQIEKLEEDCEKITKRITAELKKENMNENSRILVIGHGENGYIPSRIASYLPYDVMLKTTTRTPIHCNGKIIKDRYYFHDKGVKYYMYNKNEIEKEFEKIIFIA